jgi:hypothetical protein
MPLYMHAFFACVLPSCACPSLHARLPLHAVFPSPFLYTNAFLCMHWFLRATYRELSTAVSSASSFICSVVEPSTNQSVREGCSNCSRGCCRVFQLFGGLSNSSDPTVRKVVQNVFDSNYSGRLSKSVVSTVQEGCSHCSVPIVRAGCPTVGFKLYAGLFILFERVV